VLLSALSTLATGCDCRMAIKGGLYLRSAWAVAQFEFSAKQIGKIVFHQQDLIRHISKHRCSLIHQLNVGILIGRVGAGEQRDPPLPLRRIRGTDTTLPPPILLTSAPFWTVHKTRSEAEAAEWVERY